MGSNGWTMTMDYVQENKYDLFLNILYINAIFNSNVLKWRRHTIVTTSHLLLTNKTWKITAVHFKKGYLQLKSIYSKTLTMYGNKYINMIYYLTICL